MFSFFYTILRQIVLPRKLGGGLLEQPHKGYWDLFRRSWICFISTNITFHVVLQIATFCYTYISDHLLVSQSNVLCRPHIRTLSEYTQVLQYGCGLGKLIFIGCSKKPKDRENSTSATHWIDAKRVWMNRTSTCKGGGQRKKYLPDLKYKNLLSSAEACKSMVCMQKSVGSVPGSISR